MFFIKKLKKAYTLIELMVVVVIIAIIAISINTTNLSKMTDRQKIHIFTNKLITNIESIRNNSLIGRGIDSTLTPIYKAKITLTTAGSGELIAEYNTGSLLPYINSELSLIPTTSYSIKEVECLQINDTSDGLTASGVITIIGANFSLTGCPVTSRKLKITTKFLGNEEDFSINIVNGLIILNKGNSL